MQILSNSTVLRPLVVLTISIRSSAWVEFIMAIRELPKVGFHRIVYGKSKKFIKKPRFFKSTPLTPKVPCITIVGGLYI